METPEDGALIELPDTLDCRLREFLYRWHWHGDPDVVKRELRELIEWARIHWEL